MTTSSITSSTSANLQTTNEIAHATTEMANLVLSTNTLDDRIVTSTQPVLNNSDAQQQVNRQPAIQITTGTLDSSLPSRLPDVLVGKVFSFLTDIELVNMLEDHTPLGPDVLTTALHKRHYSVPQITISRAIKEFIKDYKRDYKSRVDIYCLETGIIQEESGAIDLPSEREPQLTVDYIAARFSLPKNIMNIADRVTELNLSAFEILSPSMLRIIANLFPNIQLLNLSGYKEFSFRCDSEAGKAIGQFKKLQTLILDDSEISEPSEDGSASFFSFLPQTITHLYCIQSKVSDKMMAAAFKRLIHLKGLDLSYTTLDGSCFLVPLPELGKLTLSNCKYLQDHLLGGGLKTMRQLEELNLSASHGITGTCLQWASPTLLNLNLSNCTNLSSFQDISLGGLQKLINLKTLHLSGTPVTGHFLQYASPSLINLYMSKCEFLRDEALEGLKRLKKIETLYLSKSAITGACLQYVSESLHTLYCSDCDQLRDVHLHSLQWLTHLTTLSLSRTPVTGEFLEYVPQSLLKLDCANCANLLDAKLKRFERLIKLQHLDICQTPTKGFWLQNAPESLLSLDAYDCFKLKDDNLAHMFLRTTQLTDLNLSHTQITGECFAFAPTTLQDLSCSACTLLSDAPFLHLFARTKQLQRLTISGTPLSGACLKNAPPSLLSLDCSHCPNLTHKEFAEGVKKMVNLHTVDISDYFDTSFFEQLSNPIVIPYNFHRISLPYLIDHVPQSLRLLKCDDFLENDIDEAIENAKKWRPSLIVQGEPGEEDAPSDDDQEDD